MLRPPLLVSERAFRPGVGLPEFRRTRGMHHLFPYVPGSFTAALFFFKKVSAGQVVPDASGPRGDGVAASAHRGAGCAASPQSKPDVRQVVAANIVLPL